MQFSLEIIIKKSVGQSVRCVSEQLIQIAKFFLVAIEVQSHDPRAQEKRNIVTKNQKKKKKRKSERPFNS